MFNLRKFAAEIDFGQKVKPDQIPGTTIEQKVQWIQNWFQNRGTSIKLEDAYRMLGHKTIEEEGLSQLEKYRANIQKLREYAGEIIKSEALKSRPDLQERIAKGEKEASKELDRVIYTLVSQRLGPIIQDIVKLSNQVFIPEFVKLYSVGTRTELDIKGLTSYQSPEEISTIRQWIAEESLRMKNEYRTRFVEIYEKYKESYPELTLENMFFILRHTKSQSYKQESITISEDVVNEIKDELDALSTKVESLNNSGAVWGRILSLHPQASNVEKWQELIGEDLKSSWTLVSVLKPFYPELEQEAAPVKFVDTKSGKVVTKSTDFLFFYPVDKPDGSPWSTEQDKKKYAVDQLRLCIESGDYDNESLFYVIGKEIKQAPSLEEKIDTNSDSNPNELEAVDSKKSKAIDNWAKLIRYYFERLCNPKKDTAGIATATTRLGIFRQDLRLAGLDHVADMLSEAYEKKPDLRYSAFDLKFLSTEEKNIVEELRQNYYLDPIPFPVKIPCPQDNPTSVDRFEIDFLLPCDTLKGFTRSITNQLDEATGEVISKYEIVPNIETQIMFVGEYFGYGLTQEYIFKDNNRPWVKPDGSRPLYFSRKANTYYEVSPKPSAGNLPARYIDYYRLKSEWKVFTTEVIADMMGTRTLSFDEKHFTPKNMMAELDAKRIIYVSPRCTPNLGCLMTKEIKDRLGENQTTKQYLDEKIIQQRFDDEKSKLLRIVDCAIINTKLSTALKQTKDTFIDSKETDNFLGIGFNRQTMNEHIQVMNDLRRRIDELQEYHLEDLENVEIYRELISTKSQLKNMYSSPLYDFKVKFEEIISKGKIAENISKLNALRDKIQSDQIKLTMSELRREIIEIDSDLVSERTEDEAL
jgi:hypothetical protein